MKFGPKRANLATLHTVNCDKGVLDINTRDESVFLLRKTISQAREGLGMKQHSHEQ